MSSRFKRIFPTGFELIALLILALSVLLLGNSKSILGYYHLDSSTHVIQQSTQHVISSGLDILDGFSFTGGIVTFVIWALVGLFCFSVVSSIANVFKGLRQERELGSRQYVHPASFTKAVFWRQVVLDFMLLFLILIVIGIVLYGFFAVALPTGLKYGHELLFHSSLTSVGGFLLATALVYGWLLVLDVCFRILAQRRTLYA